MNHDMDELFRKAGEDYPLDTSGADWEKIAKELHPAVPEHSSSRGRGKKRFLWLLLLIPFGLICNQYFTADKRFSSIKRITMGTSPVVCAGSLIGRKAMFNIEATEKGVKL